MKNMKILLALGIVTLSCSALAVGCGSDDTNTSTPDSGKPDVVLPGADGGGTDAPITETGAEASLPLGQIDRMGRPAINTALNEKPLKDPWNQADTYAFSPFGAGPTTFDTSFDGHLHLFNSLRPADGPAPGPLAQAYVWADAGTPHPLVQPLKLDVLIVDPNKPYAVKSFLEIEDTLLNGGTAASATTPGLPGPGQEIYSTCGGRNLNEDIVDKVFSYLVIRQFSGVCDGVNQATKPSTDVWPYMAAPN